MGDERRRHTLARPVASAEGLKRARVAARHRGACGGRLVDFALVTRVVGVACVSAVAMVACQATEEGLETQAARQPEASSAEERAPLVAVPVEDAKVELALDPELLAAGRVDARCPDGALLVGGAPPYGTELSCAFKSGVRHGPTQRWHDNGKPAAVGRFERGARVGPWTTYYVRSGRLESEGSYSEGLRDGEWIFYYKNGRPKEKARYARGVLVEMISLPR